MSRELALLGDRVAFSPPFPFPSLRSLPSYPPGLSSLPFTLIGKSFILRIKYFSCFSLKEITQVSQVKGNLGGGVDGVQAFNVGKADRAISGPRPSSVLSGGICHLGQSTRRKRTSFSRQSMEDL